MFRWHDSLASHTTSQQPRVTLVMHRASPGALSRHGTVVKFSSGQSIQDLRHPQVPTSTQHVGNSTCILTGDGYGVDCSLRTHSAMTDDATHITCHATPAHGSTHPSLSTTVHSNSRARSYSITSHHLAHLSPGTLHPHSHSRGNCDAAPPPRATLSALLTRRTSSRHTWRTLAAHQRASRSSYDLRPAKRPSGAICLPRHTFTPSTPWPRPHDDTTLSHTHGNEHQQNVVLREQ